MRYFVYTLFCCTWLFAQNARPLTVIFPENYPPHYFIHEGKPQGFAIDILRYIEKDLNLTFSYVPSKEVTEIVQKVTEGNFDIVPDIGISNERMER